MNAQTQRQKDICKGGISSTNIFEIKKFPDQNKGGSDAMIQADRVRLIFNY